MENNTQETTVVFRKWKKQDMLCDIIALFPLDFMGRAHDGVYLCNSYERVGQHGSADYSGVLQQTTPATESDYRALKEELGRIGYKLLTRKRAPSWRKIQEARKIIEVDAQKELREREKKSGCEFSRPI